MKDQCQDHLEEASGRLIALHEIERQLTQCNDVGELKEVRDQAEAVRNYAKAANLGLEFQNRASEIKLQPERRVGHLLSEFKLRGGDRKSNG